MKKTFLALLLGALATIAIMVGCSSKKTEDSASNTFDPPAISAADSKIESAPDMAAVPPPADNLGTGSSGRGK